MNAKKEFLEHTNNKTILCTSLSHTNSWGDNNTTNYNLKHGYNSKEHNKFMESLNFNYDNGFGGQELYGTIWYTDGTWSDRGEYDGSEWWEYNSCPIIPKELLY